MTESPEELAAVEQLLAESDALHGWLARLDQAPVSAPDGVRTRVRRDYQQRLDQITAGLRAHADVIAARLADDQREHDELHQQATVSREALAEAELRHAVGEYDGSRYQSERTRHQSDIESYELGLRAAAERIARLEDVRAMVQRAPHVDEPEGDSGSLGEPEPDRSTRISPPVEVHDVAEGAPSGIAIDDLAPDRDPDAALRVFDEQRTIDAMSSPGGSHGSPEVGPLSFRPTAGSRDAPLPTQQPPRARTFETAAPLGIPSADVPPRFVRPGERVRPPAPVTTVPSVTESPRSERTESFGEEIVATASGEGASAVTSARTLRCGECGAMNRPLEWYCEKCGAELTAL